MLPKKLQFELRNCRECGIRHHFDLDNVTFCTYKIVMVGKYGVATDISPNRVEFLRVMEQFRLSTE